MEAVIRPLAMRVRMLVMRRCPRQWEMMMGISKKMMMASNSQRGPMDRLFREAEVQAGVGDGGDDGWPVRGFGWAAGMEFGEEIITLFRG